jgi:hypothetical protein
VTGNVDIVDELTMVYGRYNELVHDFMGVIS